MVIGRGFLPFMFKSPHFLFCRFSPLGGSEVQAAVMPPAPGGYDGGFGAPEAVTPFCARFRWAVKLFGVCVVCFGSGVVRCLSKSLGLARPSFAVEH